MRQFRVSKTNEQNALLRYKLNFDLNAARSIRHATKTVREGAEGRGAAVWQAMWQDNGKA